MPPPAYYLDTDLFGIEESYRISRGGELRETIEAASADGMVTVSIPKGTLALDEDGERLEILVIAVDETPPTPPEDAHIIGLAYSFEPEGATFDPPISVTWSYDPEALPQGVAEEDLVIAYYDQAAGEWVELDCVVDTENNIITASVSHLTTFAIIGAITPPPPEEEEIVSPKPELGPRVAISNLRISPDQVSPNQPVTISINVSNAGDRGGSKTLNLMINGEFKQSARVGVSAHGKRSISFTVSRANPGVYSVYIEGATGWFTVLQAVAPSAPMEAGLGTGDVIAIVVIAIMLIGGLMFAFLYIRRSA